MMFFLKEMKKSENCLKFWGVLSQTRIFGPPRPSPPYWINFAKNWKLREKAGNIQNFHFSSEIIEKMINFLKKNEKVLESPEMLRKLT